jgi:hypothetical protein
LIDILARGGYDKLYIIFPIKIKICNFRITNESNKHVISSSMSLNYAKHLEWCSRNANGLLSVV